MSTRRAEYPQEALDLFERYRERREPYRPLECNNASACWVRDGPPSYTHVGQGNNCTGCGGAPRLRVTPGHPAGKWR